MSRCVILWPDLEGIQCPFNSLPEVHPWQPDHQAQPQPTFLHQQLDLFRGRMEKGREWDSLLFMSVTIMVRTPYIMQS